MDFPQTMGQTTTQANAETKRMRCPQCGIEGLHSSTHKAITWLCSTCSRDWVDVEALKASMA